MKPLKAYTYQHVPNIFIGPIKAAKTYAYSQQALPTPQVAGSYWCFSELQCFAAVYQHFDRFFHISLQQVLEGVIVFVLEKKMHNRFQSQLAIILSL